MTNKKIIFIPLLISAIIVGVFFFINKKPTKNNDFLNKSKSSLQCAGKGETTGAANMPNICCPGLKAVGGWPGGYNGDCTLAPPPTGLNICTSCGDGRCDIDNGENKCNCKDDCK